MPSGTQVRLITNHTEDADSSYPSALAEGGQPKKRLFYKLRIWEAYLSFLMLVSLLTPVSFAYAGFFSFVTDAFASEPEVNTAPDPASARNSQTLALLQAVAAPDPTATPSSEVTIDNSALVAETGPAGTAADVESDSSLEEDSPILYVTHKGDSLSEISKMIELKTETILWANPTIKKGQALPEGQILIIPPVDGVLYTVVKGDTLAGIAKKFKADVAEVSSFNGVTEETALALGDILMIPDGKIVEKVTPKTKTPAKKSSTKQIRGGGPAIPGYFINPVPNARLSQKLHDDNAVDLAAPKGSPIYASASGEVIMARHTGYNGGYGLVVMIAHPAGPQTLYAHMSKVKANVGDHVEQGEIIGWVGSTGKSTGPHTHFSVRAAANPFARGL